MITGATVVLKTIPCSFMSRYVCPVLVSFLAISATLIVTVSILYWNYSETMYVFIVSVFKKLALIVFILIVFILTISYFTGTSELPSPCHLLVNNFICPRYPGTQVPGTRYMVPGSQVSVGQQSFLSQVPPCHKKVHGAGPLGQEGTFPCQSD